MWAAALTLAGKETVDKFDVYLREERLKLSRQTPYGRVSTVSGEAAGEPSTPLAGGRAGDSPSERAKSPSGDEGED